MATMELFHAFEDGTTGTRAVNFELTDDLLFKINIPGYLAPTDSEPTIERRSAVEVRQAYEELCERYSRRRLTANGETSLVVKVMMQDTEYGAMFGLSLRRVVTYTDDDGVIHVVKKHDDGSIGDEVDINNGRLLPDKPEIEAKAKALIASLRMASGIFFDFMRTDDPGAFLLAIRDDWNQTSQIGDNPDGNGQESSTQSTPPPDQDDL